MLIKIGSIAVDNQKDYRHEQVKALEEKGFVLILTLSTFGTDYYDVAKQE